MEVVRALIKAGADPTAQDNDGRNPLHSAAESESPQAMEVVQALIEAGADAMAQDKHGHTPLHKALSMTLSMRHGAVAGLLRRHGTYPKGGLEF
jgi:ankyrin repeat protein